MDLSAREVKKRSTTDIPFSYGMVCSVDPSLSTQGLQMFQENSGRSNPHNMTLTKNIQKQQEDGDAPRPQLRVNSVGAVPLKASTKSRSYTKQTLLSISQQPLQENEQYFEPNNVQQQKQKQQFVRSNLDHTPNASQAFSSSPDGRTSLPIRTGSTAFRPNSFLPQNATPNIIESSVNCFQSSQPASTVGATGSEPLSMQQQEQQHPMPTFYIPTSLSLQQNIFLTTNPLPVHSNVTCENLLAATTIDGQKRALASRTADTTNALNGSTPASSPAPPSSLYLLHQACRLYAQTPSVIECALKADPQSAYRRYLAEGNPNKSKRSRSQGYSYPINIALKHNASTSVLQLLAQAAPDVLVLPDGPEALCTFAIAITLLEDDSKLLSVLRLFMECNPTCASTLDSKGNFPLHIACAKTKISASTICTIAQAHSPALQAKNFHGQRPLDIAQRCGSMTRDDIVDCLQQLTFGGLEQTACHLHDDLEHE